MARSPFIELDPFEIELDERYQRDRHEPTIERIVGEYDPRLANPPVVARRNGAWYAPDGGHTIEAARRLKQPKIWCRKIDAETAEDEAEVYVGLNTKRRQNTNLEIFKAALFRGDPVAVGLNRAVREAGLKIGTTGHDPNTVGAIKALERAYVAFGPEAVTKGLALVKRLWLGTPKGNNGDLLEGTIRFVAGYDHRLGEKQIARLDAKSARWVLEAASERKLKMGGSAYGGEGSSSIAVAHQLRKVAGLRGQPLKAGRR